MSWHLLARDRPPASQRQSGIAGEPILNSEKTGGFQGHESTPALRGYGYAAVFAGYTPGYTAVYY